MNVRCSDDRFGDDRQRVTLRAGFPTQVDFRLQPAGSLEIESQNLSDELRDAEWIVLRAPRGDGTKQRFEAKRVDHSDWFRATGIRPGKYEMPAGIEREGEEANDGDSFVELVS